MKMPNYQDMGDEELVRLALDSDDDARNALLEKHYDALLGRHAMLAGLDPNELDPVHDAILKSINDLDKLRKADRFFHRAMQFIRDGIRKRKKEQARNIAPQDDSLLPLELENMNVDPPAMTDGDRLHLRALLEQTVSHLRKACAGISSLMLQHFDEHGALPTVEEIENQAGTSHSNAHRCRKEILRVWRRICKDSGFYTPRDKKPEK